MESGFDSRFCALSKSSSWSSTGVVNQRANISAWMCGNAFMMIYNFLRLFRISRDHAVRPFMLFVQQLKTATASLLSLCMISRCLSAFVRCTVTFSFTKNISVFLQAIKITLNQLDSNLARFFLSTANHVHRTSLTVCCEEEKKNEWFRCGVLGVVCHNVFEHIFECFFLLLKL